MRADIEEHRGAGQRRRDVDERAHLVAALPVVDEMKPEIGQELRRRPKAEPAVDAHDPLDAGFLDEREVPSLLRVAKAVRRQPAQGGRRQKTGRFAGDPANERRG